MPHSPSKLINDALRACEELKVFTGGKSLADVEKERSLQLIIEREFEILGEALKRLRDIDEMSFAKLSNGHRIIGTRNILAHGYDVVEYVILWDAIQDDIPKLEKELESLFP